jgi:hypothetical protein
VPDDGTFATRAAFAATYASSHQLSAGYAAGWVRARVTMRVSGTLPGNLQSWRHPVARRRGRRGSQRSEQLRLFSDGPRGIGHSQGHGSGVACGQP